MPFTLGDSIRNFIGVPRRTVFFQRILDALPPGTQVLESSDSDHGAPMWPGVAVYILGILLASLFASSAAGPVIVVGVGVLFGLAHGFNDERRTPLGFVQLMVVPAILVAIGFVFDPVTPDSEVLTGAVGMFLLPPIAGFAASPVLRTVWRSKRAITDVQPMPGWLRRATDSGRAVALLRSYARSEQGEASLAQDRLPLEQLGYELADTTRTGAADEPNVVVGLLDVLLTNSALESNREERLILALFVKSSVLHRNDRLA